MEMDSSIPASGSIADMFLIIRVLGRFCQPLLWQIVALDDVPQMKPHRVLAIRFSGVLALRKIKLEPPAGVRRALPAQPVITFS